MFGSQFGLVATLGADSVRNIADTVVSELSLPSQTHAAVCDLFVCEDADSDTRTLNNRIAAALNSLHLTWPRLEAWRKYFDDLGMRPYMWGNGVFPDLTWHKSPATPADIAEDLKVKDVRAELKLAGIQPKGRKGAEIRAQLIEHLAGKDITTRGLQLRLRQATELRDDHRAGIIELLSHYVLMICHTEQSMRSSGLSDGYFMSSDDPAEQHVEQAWLKGRGLDSIFRVSPPLFPGHRASMTAFEPDIDDEPGIKRTPRKGVWIMK